MFQRILPVLLEELPYHYGFMIVFSGTKPGECPSVSIKNAVSCSGPQCEEDGDCPGAQRCCADSYCATPRCQDPINLWECVFEVNGDAGDVERNRK